MSILKLYFSQYYAENNGVKQFIKSDGTSIFYTDMVAVPYNTSMKDGVFVAEVDISEEGYKIVDLEYFEYVTERYKNKEK